MNYKDIFAILSWDTTEYIVKSSILLLVSIQHSWVEDLKN